VLFCISIPKKIQGLLECFKIQGHFLASLEFKVGTETWDQKWAQNSK